MTEVMTGMAWRGCDQVVGLLQVAVPASGQCFNAEIARIQEIEIAQLFGPNHDRTIIILSINNFRFH